MSSLNEYKGQRVTTLIRLRRSIKRIPYALLQRHMTSVTGRTPKTTQRFTDWFKGG
jgi:hypothetical protein